MKAIILLCLLFPVSSYSISSMLTIETRPEVTRTIRKGKKASRRYKRKRGERNYRVLREERQGHSNSQESRRGYRRNKNNLLRQENEKKLLDCQQAFS